MAFQGNAHINTYHNNKTKNLTFTERTKYRYQLHCISVNVYTYHSFRAAGQQNIICVSEIFLTVHRQLKLLSVVLLCCY